MESNWTTTYRSGQPLKGPGPFQTFVGHYQAVASTLPNPDGSAREHGWPLVQVARSLSYYPAPPPFEGGVSVSGAARVLAEARTATGEPDDTMLLAAVGRAVADGPKLFRPTARQCEPLEQVEVGLTAADYAQPFPVCVVEFPPDYAGDRAVPSPTDAVPVRPGFAVVVRENGVLVVNVLLPEERGGTGSDFLSMPVSRSTVEAVLGREGPGRRAVYAPLVRAALNYLMLAAGGHRLIGPVNPTQEAALRKRLKRARGDRREDRIEELRARLRQLPNVYGLAQDIRLFDRDRSPGEPNPDADGSPKTPHWRKGHWRRVAVGVGRAERRPVFIRPVLVNAHLMTD